MSNYINRIRQLKERIRKQRTAGKELEGSKRAGVSALESKKKSATVHYKQKLLYNRKTSFWHQGRSFSFEWHFSLCIQTHIFLDPSPPPPILNLHSKHKQQCTEESLSTPYLFIIRHQFVSYRTQTLCTGILFKLYHLAI